MVFSTKPDTKLPRRRVIVVIIAAVVVLKYETRHEDNTISVDILSVIPLYHCYATVVECFIASYINKSAFLIVNN